MPRRVVIDTDLGVDDALALLLAFQSPELRVEAITTVCGNVPVDQATENAARILELVNPASRPILAKGAKQPLAKALVTAQWVHGADGLGELARFKNLDSSPRYPKPSLPADLPSAVDVLLDLASRYPEEITLITLGPLTNLAEALRRNEKRVKQLRDVVVMGGAVNVPGNITPAAEFNIFVDPHAAREVISAGIPLTLVPLDVTEKVRLTSREIEEMSQVMGGVQGRFIWDMTRQVLDYMKGVHGEAVLTLHDPLAVAVAIDADLVSTTPLRVDVETEGEITQGMTLADLRRHHPDCAPAPNVRAALKVDASRFVEFFKERLCRRSL